MQYNTFDLFAVTVTVFCTARVLRTGDTRFWIATGIGVGIGALSKYSIAFPVLGLLLGLALLPSQRHHLRSRWFWCGVLAAAILAAPNLIWLAHHHFITLQMEHFIHARDIRLGRTDQFYSDQLKYTMFGFLIAVTGLVPPAQRVLSRAAHLVHPPARTRVLHALCLSRPLCRRLRRHRASGRVVAHLAADWA
jgi:4-amino-4-deoxy-L-arabinose transferase-like glycosyltransferase